MAEQAFSLEKHLSAWQARQDTVEVEGVVQEDGDWYVIAPDPHQPGLLYRVRKSDVAERRESRVAEAAGVKHQMHALRVKKGVPVARISFIQSDQLVMECGRRTALTSISVTFKNNTVFVEKWTIKDGTTGQVIFDNYLQPRDEQGDEVALSLSAPGGRFGEAYYKHDGQSIFTHVDLLEAGDTVDMN